MFAHPAANEFNLKVDVSVWRAFLVDFAVCTKHDVFKLNYNWSRLHKNYIWWLLRLRFGETMTYTRTFRKSITIDMRWPNLNISHFSPNTHYRLTVFDNVIKNIWIHHTCPGDAHTSTTRDNCVIYSDWYGVSLFMKIYDECNLSTASTVCVYCILSPHRADK